MHGRIVLALLAGLAGLALVGVAAEILGSAEILREGRLSPYSSAYLLEVRFLDSVDIWISEEISLSVDVVLDALHSFALVCVAGIALLSLTLLRRLAAGARRMGTFFGIAAVGAVYLAVDEMFAIHESIGYNMRFLADLPGITQPDGAIVAAYLVLIGVYLYVFRDLLLSSRRAKQWFLIGVGLGVSAMAIDLMALPFEEFVEIAGTLSFLAGFLVLSADLMANALGRETVTPTRDRLA